MTTSAEARPITTAALANAAFGDDTRAAMEAKKTEIAAIQERMKELGL